MRSTPRLIPLVLLLPLAASCTGSGAPAIREEVVRHNIRGTAYLSQQKWAEAESEFRRALALRPQDPLLLTNTAVALIQRDAQADAERLLRQALIIDPQFPYAHYDLGLLHDQRGEFSEAATHFAAVTRTDPRDAFAHYHLGAALVHLERFDEGAQALRTALVCDPTHLSSLYALGRLLVRRGDAQEGARLIGESQRIRARSGLDVAVGLQYGEQGPYAMGIDYPGDVLAAPRPIDVRFVPQATSPPLPAPAGAAISWTAGAPAPGAAPWLWLADGQSVRRLTETGWSTPAAAPARWIRAGDLNGDGQLELVAVREERGGLSWTVLPADPAAPLAADATAAFAPPLPIGPGTLAGFDLTLVDLDHDGDLDVFCCWTLAAAAGGASAGCGLGIGDGAGRFAMRPSREHGFEMGGGLAGPVQVTFSDFDNDRDIDLIASEPTAVHVWSNQRDGTFADLSQSAGLGSTVGGVRSIEIADLNKDGFMDLLTGGDGGVQLHLNRGGRFEASTVFGSGAMPSGGAVLVADYDNDGFLDVVWPDAEGLAFQRNDGRGASTRQPDLVQAGTSGGRAVAPLAALDVDADGGVDLVALTERGEVVLLRNAGGNANGWIQLESRGVGDNRRGIGAKVEVLSGALRQKFEVTRPLPLAVGLGRRQAVQSARYVWPSGVLQDEVDLPAGSRREVAQLDRKGTSCPLLYAWRAGGWRFVTDFLGGCAIGYRHAPGVLNVPDTDEYVRIDGGLERDETGKLRVRLNNQLEEVIWFDAVELVVVEHPLGSEVHPDERLMPGPPWPSFELFASATVRPVARATTVEDGRNVSALLAESDRRFVDGFGLLPYKGYATPHALELDLGPFPARERVVLLLDGWIDYADSTSNIAAAQAGVSLQAPRLLVAKGRDFVERPGVMGFPAGLPKTMAIDLTDLFPSADHRLRIETSMCIYWDRARLMLGGKDTPLRVTRVKPAHAELRFGGFPREASPDGRPPFAYDPQSVAQQSPWKAHVGAYTSFGDVTEPLLDIDDVFVTTRSGDEIELRFALEGEAPAGWTRTFLLYADGFGKDMDPNSAASDEVGPIPFHGMPVYPYGPEVVPPVAAERGTAGARRVVRSAAGLPGAVPQVLAVPSDARDRR